MTTANTKSVGIIMNGVTGRMGTNQHLMQSVLAIAQQGGVRVSDQEVVVPDPVLVGRNSAKLQQLSRSSGVRKWTTNLEEALADGHNSIYFDSQTSSLRASSVKKAIAAGKHVYCEKPAALTTDQALQLYSLAQQANLKNGVVQDKLWLPGVQKLNTLKERGSLGRFSRYAGNSATGSLPVTRWPRSGPPGTTGKKRAAESFWTCSPTDGTCWITFLVKWKPCAARARLT